MAVSASASAVDLRDVFSSILVGGDVLCSSKDQSADMPIFGGVCDELVKFHYVLNNVKNVLRLILLESRNFFVVVNGGHLKTVNGALRGERNARKIPYV